MVVVVTQEEPSGFLSVNRVMSLDSLEVDLSKEPAAPINHNAHQQIDAETNVIVSNRVRYKSAPICREQEKWDRATKAAIGGSLKRKLQMFTLGIGGVGLVSAYVSYSPEIAASCPSRILANLHQLDFAPYVSGSYNAQWNAPELLHDKHMLHSSRILGKMEVEESLLGLWLPLHY
ncbi:Protein CONSERVED ONLY IN THE GREEN LINEAGE 160, chloroplastic [Glycine soja]|uniref:Protein CONSERVED ONLY IN THE GREEN LINEAGE 160, chloroplastic n=1 Tax=Glycine soja TaxID=3848 RepID=A0A445HPB0_GLYSO|nr:Protein CONSERVED ONLY IN THE GREEN LINEAGE 160, chloroplastic [Glycine soja]